MTSRPLARLATVGLVATVSLSLAGCKVGTDSSADGRGDGAGSADGGATGADVSDGPGAKPTQQGPKVRVNVGRGASGVPVSTLVKVGAASGSLTSVVVSSPDGDVPGDVAADGRTWTATERLEPGTTYVVRGVAEDSGATTQFRQRFTTQDLSLDQQTYPSIAPLSGETVGVGMPVIVSFDVPVTDKAAFEKQMHVTSTPAQEGSWYWISSTEAHWRPRAYWRPGTKVQVAVDVNGVDAGNGIYGQQDRETSFTVGKAHIYQVNAKTDQMKVFENGKLLRTIPITTGKPGFTTRSGVKVIIEKFAQKRMNSETVGIPADSAEAYDIDDVKWAMRVTYSGEFLHAAPWSVASQGHANVSHGCTGMSTSDAAWVYAMSRRGDVVEYTGTDRRMEFTNGYGDWNKSFKDYREGSAL